MNKYAKAIVGSMIVGLTAVDMALQDNVFTLREAVRAAIAVLVNLYVVYLVPNAQPGDPLPSEPPVDPIPIVNPTPIPDPVQPLIVPTEPVQ